VTVTKNLTLTGAGRADTVLNGNKLGTVLTVSPGVTATVSGVTVKGGTGTATTIEGDAAQAGGGILNQGTLALKNVAVTGNHVTAAAVGDNFVSAFGGGVFNADGGTLTVSGSVIKGNSVRASTAGSDQALAAGGGISSDATFQTPTADTSIGTTTISGNTATAESTGEGPGNAEGGGVGLIYSASAAALAGDTISGKKATATVSGAGTAGAAGGGLAGAASQEGNAISASTINANTAIGSNDGTGAAGAGGGGIGGIGGIGTVTSPVVTPTVDGNVARATGSGATPDGAVLVNVVGGAIGTAENEDTDSTGSPINSSTFANNKATSAYTGTGAGAAQVAGGAIAASTGISNSTVNGNTATATGSGTGVEIGSATAARQAVAALTAPAAATHAPGQAPALGLRALGTLVRAQVQATVGLLTAHPAARTRPGGGADVAVLTSASSDGAGIGGLTGPASNITVRGNSAGSTSTGAGAALTEAGGIAEADTLVNDTIAGNTGAAIGPTGSGVTAGSVGTVTAMTNTVVAGNTPADCGADTGTDGGGNLDGDGSCGLSAPNGSISGGTADLGPLASNGGPTRTQAPARQPGHRPRPGQRLRAACRPGRCAGHRPAGRRAERRAARCLRQRCLRHRRHAVSAAPGSGPQETARPKQITRRGGRPVSGACPARRPACSCSAPRRWPARRAPPCPRR
jgi:hypothetical protein